MSENVNFGRGKNRKMQYVIIGSLGLIVVGCLAVVSYHVFGHGGSGADVDNVPSETHFKCAKEDCGNEFTMTFEELRQARQETPVGADPTKYVLKVRCKKCGELSALPESQCPSCHGWFLAPQQPATGVQGAPPDPKAVTLKCPLCGIDVNEWYIKDAQKKYDEH